MFLILHFAKENFHTYFRKFIRQAYFNNNQLPIISNKIMQQREYYQNRIFRKQLRNLSTQKKSQSLPKQNSFFYKIRKNKAVICLKQQKQNEKINDQSHIHLHKQSRLTHVGSNKGQHFDHKQRQSNLTSRQSDEGNNQNNLLKMSKRTQSLLLPKVNKISKEKYKNRIENQENSIGATILGSLSTTQILKKRQLQIKMQEMARFLFLENHIKNLKSTEHEDDQQFLTSDKSITMNQSFTPVSSLQLRLSNSSDKNADDKIAFAQQRFKNVLKGQLSQSDYIQYNKKLLQKNVVSKRKYFQRYKNILQKQRAQIK